MSARFELVGEAATRKAGQNLGELLLNEPVGKQAFVLALEGELGAGKTTFVRGLAKGLGIREKITSPSFLIAKRYEVSTSRRRRRSFGLYPQDDGGWVALWHFDFYRLEHPTKRDLELLDFQNILRDPRNIVAIEWAERVVQFLPKQKLVLQFEAASSQKRRLVIAEHP